MSGNEENLTGHNYDGIEEYDNPLPAWWLWTFLLTIIFGFHYWIHYEFGGGTTQLEDLKQDMAYIQSLQKNLPPVEDNEEAWMKLMASSEVLAEGKEDYQAKCAVCHGVALQGIIGPNLVDEYWINGKGKPSDIANVIRKGVLDKGMPNWDSQLKDEDIKAITVFIKSNYGTHPPNPKAPQGEKIE